MRSFQTMSFSFLLVRNNEPLTFSTKSLSILQSHHFQFLYNIKLMAIPCQNIFAHFSIAENTGFYTQHIIFSKYCTLPYSYNNLNSTISHLQIISKLNYVMQYIISIARFWLQICIFKMNPYTKFQLHIDPAFILQPMELPQPLQQDFCVKERHIQYMQK